MPIQWLDRDGLVAGIKDAVHETKVVIDIGCGIYPQGFFMPRLHICCEPHAEYVKHLSRAFAGHGHIHPVCSTGWEYVQRLPDKSVDSVFLIDVIEHIDKADGWKLLGECERVAREQIMLFTPLGFMPQDYEEGETDAWGLHGGTWQSHRSGWQPEEFESAWEVLACRDYHRSNGKGEQLSQVYGAFWAIKNLVNPRARLEHKLGIVTATLQERASVLNKLLGRIDVDSYCILSQEAPPAFDRGIYFPIEKLSHRLPAHYHQLPPKSRINHSLDFEPIRSITWAANTAWEIWQRAHHIYRVLRQEKCQVLLVCAGGQAELMAGYLAACWAGIPYFVFSFDDSTARPISRAILQQAAGAFVMTEQHRDAYLQAGVKTILLLNAEGDMSMERTRFITALHNFSTSITGSGQPARETWPLLSLVWALCQKPGKSVPATVRAGTMGANPRVVLSSAHSGMSQARSMTRNR